MSRRVIERLVAVAGAGVLGLVAAAVSAVLLGTPAQAAPEQQTWGGVLVAVSGPRTGAFTSTAASMRSYTLLQYGGSLALSSGQAITARVQTSFDNGTWFDYVTIHANATTAVTVTPAQTNAVGLWMRVIYMPLSATLTYTPTLWVVGK